MGGDSEVDALLKWLEESGRALELRTMRAFRRYAQVQHSVHYADQDSGKVRESDVLARFYGSRGGGRLAHLDVVVECKTGKPGRNGSPLSTAAHLRDSIPTMTLG